MRYILKVDNDYYEGLSDNKLICSTHQKDAQIFDTYFSANALRRDYATYYNRSDGKEYDTIKIVKLIKKSKKINHTELSKQIINEIFSKSGDIISLTENISKDYFKRLNDLKISFKDMKNISYKDMLIYFCENLTSDCNDLNNTLDSDEPLNDSNTEQIHAEQIYAALKRLASNAIIASAACALYRGEKATKESIKKDG